MKKLLVILVIGVFLVSAGFAQELRCVLGNDTGFVSDSTLAVKTDQWRLTRAGFVAANLSMVFNGPYRNESLYKPICCL